MPSDIRLVAWSDADLELLRRANTPEMWKHLGGPESDEKVLRRHQRYLPANWTGGGGMFRIELEPTHEPVGLVGYWDRDENAPSNALCRRLGFTLLGATDFEFPPGHPMRCKDWAFDL
jgi:RimJ/RimL family protein N-acetyltransferase